jgi:succinyl-diaminopimelate desuccinylase
MRAVEALAPLRLIEPLDVELEGLVFREVLTVTQIEGGVATNVVPARAAATLNFRYAPSRSPDEAEARLRELVGADGFEQAKVELELLGNSPPARVAAASPLVQTLCEAGPFAIEPKQAWTPVAEFSAQGLDAVNFGPGATRYAHAVDERVETSALARCYDALSRFAATVPT